MRSADVTLSGRKAKGERMQYRAYGNLGFKVSALGFGVMRLPEMEDGSCDYDRAVPILQRGIDLGITYLDTAHFYLKGTSELAVGKAIKGYDRGRLTVATKIRAYTEEDARADVWRAKLDRSLERLDSDYIDFLLFANLRWAHFDAWVRRPGMALEATRKACAEGLVRHVCFSSHDAPENVVKLIDTGEFAGMLVQYNCLDRQYEGAIARAAGRGMGVATMGPLSEGRLASPKGILAGNTGVPGLKAPELALRFVWSNPHVSVALSGMNETVQIEENVASADRAAAASEEERAQIGRLFEHRRELAESFCAGCGDCMPCPSGVNIPENFRYMNWCRVWGLEDEAREAYGGLTGESRWQPWAGMVGGLRAEACVQCGECEPRCPQNIPIIEQLEEVAATLG
jgi:predicted aldo/keto reductase-like oxidoreductase